MQGNVQNSIACSICDCWTHQKCTNLTLSEFNNFCDPENSELRFYCQICLYGTECNKENQTCLTASEIGLIDPNDIYNLSPNSIFRDKDDVPTTEYFTAEELNFEIQKSPDNIRLIHINAVSLPKNVNAIIDMISTLQKLPSIIFISETKIQDDKENFQKDQIIIPGYKFVLDNSPTNAGGTAIYVSDDLVWNKRGDIKFNFSNCEVFHSEIFPNLIDIKKFARK